MRNDVEMTVEVDEYSIFKVKSIRINGVQESFEYGSLHLDHIFTKLINGNRFNINKPNVVFITDNEGSQTEIGDVVKLSKSEKFVCERCLMNEYVRLTRDGTRGCRMYSCCMPIETTDSFYFTQNLRKTSDEDKRIMTLFKASKLKMIDDRYNENNSVHIHIRYV